MGLRQGARLSNQTGMALTYYIDGYNIIHHCPQLRPLAHRDFEAARDALVDRVSRYCAVTGETASVVFDGRGRVTDLAAPLHASPGVDVIYSPAHQSADAYIERCVYESGDRLQIVVVSGDRGIRDLCRGLGTLTMTPRNFLGAVTDRLARELETRSFRQSHHNIRRLEDRLDHASHSHLHRLKRKFDPHDKT